MGDWFVLTKIRQYCKTHIISNTVTLNPKFEKLTYLVDQCIAFYHSDALHHLHSFRPVINDAKCLPNKRVSRRNEFYDKEVTELSSTLLR